MPRNGSGVYTLPPSNPVVPFTPITTTWANPTLEDIASALTNSLDRTGAGGMLAPFRVNDGVVSAPGLAFTNEISLGMYRVGAGVMGFASSGAAICTIASDRISTLLRQDHYGFDTYRFSGQFNWKVYDDASGNFVVAPSTLVNGDIYDLTKGFSINPTTGVMTVLTDLDVVGTITAGTWTFSSVNATTITTTGNMTSSAGMIATFMQANQNIINPNIVAGAAATAINFNTSQSWAVTLSAPLTITTISGLTAGNIGRVTFVNTSNAVTFPSTVKWPGPTFTKPDFTAGPLKRVVVVMEFDGTNFLANAAIY